jgi:hypothetical protein
MNSGTEGAGQSTKQWFNSSHQGIEEPADESPMLCPFVGVENMSQ